MDHEFYMKRALTLAKRGIGRTSPNPCVGACIVKKGRIISEGYHKRAGQMHAEATALKNAKEDLKGAVLYVNLEPCSTFGRTGPCTDLIIKSKIKRVVIGCNDPNPAHSGNGIKILKNAGIQVITDVLKKEAQLLNEPFFKYITKKTPYVTLKIAATLNGKIADYKGMSKWITCSSSRAYVQKLRQQADGILTGANTVRIDDPLLSFRGRTSYVKNFKKIIFSKQLDIPINSRIFSDMSLTPLDKSKEVLSNGVNNQVVIITCCDKQSKIDLFRDNGIKIIKVKGSKQGVDVKQALKQLAKSGITHILVEAGASINSLFLSNNLVDRIIYFIAPKIIPGKDALGAFDLMNKTSLKNAVAFKDIKVKRFEDDIVIEAKPIKE